MSTIKKEECKQIKKDIFINNNNNNIVKNDESKFVGNTNVSKNNSIAKRRWAILAKALQSPTQLTSYVEKISLRHFTGYTLIERSNCWLNNSNNKNHNCNNNNNNDDDNNVSQEEWCWYLYTARFDDVDDSKSIYSVYVRHPKHVFTPAQLSGFNNTGNICIWPSEEILAFYALANPQIFLGRSVLELGGGMSCLAGLMIAFHLQPKFVHLTDGNSTAIDNVYRSITKNLEICQQNASTASKYNVMCSVLKWGQEHDKMTYDIIICADCLFFDDCRLDLIETIWNYLSVDGIAFAMAPNRNNTLQEFMIEAKLRGFFVHKMYYYNKCVWDRHVVLLNDNPDYNEDIHYPILLKLTKNISY